MAAESDETAVKVAEANIANIVHVRAVEDVQTDMMRAFLERRQVKAIIVGVAALAKGIARLIRPVRGSRMRGPDSLSS